MARSPVGLVVSALALSFAMTACSGMTSGNGSLPGSADITQTIGDTADALLARRTGSQNAGTGISAANVLGSRIRQLSLASVDDAWADLLPNAARTNHLRRCEDGIELFAPDRNGDANSTEALVFYDQSCASLAVDDLRTYTPTGSHSETVHHTAAFYAPGSSAAIAVAVSTSSISNATIGRFGLPDVAGGFANLTAARVVVGKSQVLSTAGEFVMMPGNRSSGAFCGDSAGYDPAGIVSLDSTFGWQGGVLSGGTRTAEGSGFVNWSAAPSGTAYAGPIGSLSLSMATQNVSCPIARPDFTLAGGSALGTYKIPISATFHRGRIWSITVRSAVLPGGDTLSVRTNHARHQASRDYISGAIRNGRTSVATFAVNAFGNGTLTVTSTGAQYKIADWIVIQ